MNPVKEEAPRYVGGSIWRHAVRVRCKVLGRTEAEAEGQVLDRTQLRVEAEVDAMWQQIRDRVLEKVNGSVRR